MTTTREVWRLDVSQLTCSSAAALLDLRLRRTTGVEALSVSEDGQLLVLGFTGVDLTDDLLRAAVSVGLEPGALAVSPFERAADSKPLSLAEAQRLGLVETPRQPVRAEMETVQRITVAVTDGYDPDTIIVAAGVPVDIVFSEGHGCLGRVVFDDLGIEADLEHGGATVRLPALEPGTYPFRCGMDMVHGALIVE